jgi:Ca2+-binding EF-hand superfamily protein
MSKRTFLIAAAGALLIGGAVVAISAPGHRGGGMHGWHGGPMMHGEDEGGRGMRGRFGRALSKDEFDTRTREMFARIDKNSDGTIEASEIEAQINERLAGRFGRRGAGEGRDGMMGERMLRRLGAGPDGKLTKEQLRTEITRRFSEMDLNSDGKIDDADLPPTMRGRNALAEGRMGRGGGPLQSLRMLGIEAKDGAIARADVLVAADRHFDRLDRNKDGVVDKADTDALRKETVDYYVKRFAHRAGGAPDGRITREQFQARAAERFQRMDLDGDGTISRGERGGWGGRRGHRGPGYEGGMMGPDGGMGPPHGKGPMAPGKN